MEETTSSRHLHTPWLLGHFSEWLAWNEPGHVLCTYRLNPFNVTL